MGAIDYSKPIRTKGQKTGVRILCTDGPGQKPVVGFVDGEDEVMTWSRDGRFFGAGEASAWDLENCSAGEYIYCHLHMEGKADPELITALEHLVRASHKTALSQLQGGK